VNFVGKILGQGGENVKRLQEMAGCRIAVLGRGSMKDKNKVREITELTIKTTTQGRIDHFSIFFIRCP